MTKDEYLKYLDGRAAEAEKWAKILRQSHDDNECTTQLPEQMMEHTERNTDWNDPKSVLRGWFAIDRNSAEGIAEPPV